MDNTSLGEMDLQQIPKEFRPNRHEHKSPWAIIVIIIIVILFGAFWIIENKKINASVGTTTATPEIPSHPVQTLNPTNDLEASVGAIDIPSYSDDL